MQSTKEERDALIALFKSRDEAITRGMVVEGRRYEVRIAFYFCYEENMQPNGWGEVSESAVIGVGPPISCAAHIWAYNGWASGELYRDWDCPC